MFKRNRDNPLSRHRTHPDRPTWQSWADSPASGSSHVGDWSHIDHVRREWPSEPLDRTADLRAWEEGVRLYDNDDYRSMMRCALLLSQALAHNLYGEGILGGDDLVETVRKVLWASVASPPDGRTFDEDAQRCARLALTIVREFGWQPVSMGGSGLLERCITGDKGTYMLYCTAIAPAGTIVGDLRAFFAVPPQPVAEIPNPHHAVVDELEDVLHRADSGDPAKALYVRALGLWMRGDRAAAMSPMVEAARLGDIRAMKEVGDLSMELGYETEARMWFEAAAKAGNAKAMFNMGAFAVRAGDQGAAEGWYRRAAEAGDPEGFAALTQLAHEHGDSGAERRWARLGAEAGQGFCIFRHGLHLLMDANGDLATLRRAAAFLEASADRGDIDGILMAGTVNSQLGNTQRARMWYDRARETGDPKALDMLSRQGL